MATKRATSSTKKATTAKKSPAKKAPAKKAPSKAPAKKSSAAKETAAAPAEKAPAKKMPPRAPAKADPAKQSAAGKARSAKTVAPSKAPAKRPAPEKSPFDKSFLDSQRRLLLEERQTLESQAESLIAEADALARDREPGDVQFDDESGEGDTLAVERDFDLARAAAARHTIEEIDEALVRMDKGIYGICEYSGQEIPKERLKAIPYARERVEFKTRSFR